MSASYASRLSEYPNKGKCGLPEQVETKRSLVSKTKRLAEWVQNAKGRTVVLTGAGISTSSGIPDFRGPNGVWTKEQEKQQDNKKSTTRKPPPTEVCKRPREENNDNNNKAAAATSDAVMDFTAARPTLTHKAITKLAQLGLIRFCITQNVDGLHRRSGLPRSQHAVLHGCVFTEKCHGCHTEYFREQDVGGMSFQTTGRYCEDESCQTELRDTLLDWEDELPERDFERATAECEEADLVICLGTSLRIQPAGKLPTLAKKFCIINLQETPYDGQAALVIRGLVDEVMNSLMEHLGYPDWEQNWTPPPVERVSKLPTTTPPAEKSSAKKTKQRTKKRKKQQEESGANGGP